MVTQGGVTTQLGQERLCRGSHAHPEGGTRAFSNMATEGLSGQLDSVLREAGGRGAQRVDAAVGGVSCRDERDDLASGHLLQDLFVAADDAASPCRHRQPLKQPAQGGPVDSIVEAVEANIAAKRPRDDPRALQDGFDAGGRRMDPGTTPGELGAQVRVHHAMRICDEAQ
jgi:hypothetical protein